MQTGQVRYLTVYGAWGTSRADYIISLEGDRDGRYGGGSEGPAKKRSRGQGGSACFPGGEVCRAHPRAHQRNHPPTIDYYLSNLHSNRALVQICTPCFDPFGNPLQILPRPPAWLLVRHSVSFLLRCRLFSVPGIRVQSPCRG